MPPRLPKRLDHGPPVRPSVASPRRRPRRGRQPEGLYPPVVEPHRQDRLRGVQRLGEEGAREGEGADVFKHAGGRRDIQVKAERAVVACACGSIEVGCRIEAAIGPGEGSRMVLETDKTARVV